MRQLELLAPARDLICGQAAIDHGADAVYIGASRFGARAAAGNSVDDIGRLCQYARQYGVKVYVTVNTILYDDELQDTARLLDELYAVGVDAILVQDMGVLRLPLPPIALHASTQTDNRTADKVRWLSRLGFSRVVLARELSLSDIRHIHEMVPDVELEVFVHGALCVSYSGLCYASQCCFCRSANRGECAQFCRMPFDLVDADGTVIEHDRHLLSLKDMCRIDYLEQLAEAGATSFKIEGRLKDAAYVKNVTAAYSQQLDRLVSRFPDLYCRASRGRCSYTFTPDLHKTFNRGFTDYFLMTQTDKHGHLHNRPRDIASFDTPKAMGEPVGTVKEVRRDSFTVAGISAFANGDGLCFIDAKRQLQGFRVNRAQGNRLFPQSIPAGLRPGLSLYRNHDAEFERLLSRPSATRKIGLRLSLTPVSEGFRLSATTADASDPLNGASVTVPLPHQQADKPQADNIVRQLSKWGNTPYECTAVDLPADFPYFIPSSVLSAMRRQLEDAKKVVSSGPASPESQRPRQLTAPAADNEPAGGWPNISNRLACEFYGVDAPTAYELHPAPDALLMQCRHCLRFSLGYCARQGGRPPRWHEPLSLRLADGRLFPLQFDCRHCQMNVRAGRSSGKGNR